MNSVKFGFLSIVVGVAAAMNYWQRKNEILGSERLLSVGGDIILREDEKTVNNWLLHLKQSELSNLDCPAHAQFSVVYPKIENSGVFRFIRKLPKGGSLHVHLFASVSYNYVYDNLLRRENVFLCEIDGRLKLKFLSNKTENCKRVLDHLEDTEFQKWLQSNLVLNSEDVNKKITEVWDKFKKIFTLTYDLFTYVKVFEDYVYQMLLEHYEDNVLYVEVKAPFVYLYELDGTTYDEEYFVHTLYKINQKFKKNYTRFVGIKYICALYRKLDTETLKSSISTLKKLIVKYPDFIIGIDFVGFEGDASLTDNIEILKQSGLNFYFHAGETNNYGDTIDENLIDAILLGSKRIGHAFSMTKHPNLQKIVKDNNIAIEVCPISNQVLKLVTDFRNHPAAAFIASGLPTVVCNDDPGNWNAKGLSYDWYVTFMAMTHKKCGIEFLKKLSWNSIEYSGMNDIEKQGAFAILEEDWNKFINQTLLLCSK